jgi:hypothetical protein
VLQGTHDGFQKDPELYEPKQKSRAAEGHYLESKCISELCDTAGFPIWYHLWNL